MPSTHYIPSSYQMKLYMLPLDEILDRENTLYKLRHAIDYRKIEKLTAEHYKIKKTGRLKYEGTLMSCLLMLQALQHTSDKKTAEFFQENVYWQYLCGLRHYDRGCSISESTIRRFRERAGEELIQKLFGYIMEVGLAVGCLKKKNLQSVLIDTTVQEKNVEYPTDLRLLNKAHKNLIRLANKYNISLHETFARFFTLETLKINLKYKSSSKVKSKISSIKKLKTRLGRLIRNFDKKLSTNEIKPSEDDKAAIDNLKHIHAQSCRKIKDLKKYREENKYIYSLHAPETECIGKGKIHKPYEFGNKVSIALSSQNNFILGIKSFHGNPYDGHTLKDTVESVEKITKSTVEQIFVDRGYRGNDYKHKSRVFMPGTKKALSEGEKKLMRRRNAIEPVIGHLKRFFRMGTNYLKGKSGDILNPILAAIGFNLRSICNRLKLNSP